MCTLDTKKRIRRKNTMAQLFTRLDIPLRDAYTQSYRLCYRYIYWAYLYKFSLRFPSSPREGRLYSYMFVECLKTSQVRNQKEKKQYKKMHRLDKYIKFKQIKRQQQPAGNTSTIIDCQTNSSRTNKPNWNVTATHSDVSLSLSLLYYHSCL
jgi:hypothetical protein